EAPKMPAHAPAPQPPAAAPPPAPAGPKREKRSAVALAKKQREISVSEFFEKNRHLLGFDSPAKALLTAVKEAVDNALDACEEAGILPEIHVELVETQANTRYRLSVQDNGPGIVKAQIPRVFGKLLYGSKFHRLKQSRGQQGIGISAAGLYGQLTTGKPVVITSRTGKRAPAHHFELVIDTKRNEPHVIVDEVLDAWPVEHGTRVEIELAGAYKAGRRSVDEYLEQTALANPHATITWSPPRERSRIELPRVVEALPPEPEEIKPHPHGVEVGVLLRMLRDAGGRSLSAVLTQDFSRVSARLASEIAMAAGFTPRTRASSLDPAQGEKLHAALQAAKLIAPSTASVVPIGEELIRKGLEREAPKAELYVTRSRPPRVYRGNPFLVEVGLAYGGEIAGMLEHVGAGATEGIWIAGIALEPGKRVDQGLMTIPGMTRAKAAEICGNARVESKKKVAALTTDEVQALRQSLEADLRADAAGRPIELVRLANRVPLQFLQSACAITQAVIDTNWKRYGLAQPRGGLPAGPMVLVVHIASVWVPFTNEAKEAIAHIPEIVEEIQRGLQECGRQLGAYLNKRAFAKVQAARRDKLELYAGELVEALHALTGRPKDRIRAAFEVAQKKNLGEIDGEEEAGPAGGQAAAEGPAPAGGEDGEG
ncbi:MAG TPA: DNA topoisomerase VI subunit B, partial [Planctomycetota bacterium]|nr:DNA topoisomerase VI subunit B [Planctomycetota bacterium]